MSFEIVTTSFRAKVRRRSLPGLALACGAITAISACYVCLMGLAVMFNDRWIVSGVLSLGQLLVGMLPLACGCYLAVRASGRSARQILFAAAVAGTLAGGGLVALLLLGETTALRTIFVNASPALRKFLSFGLGPGLASLVLCSGAALLALSGAALCLARKRLRSALVAGFGTCLSVGLLQDLLRIFLDGEGLPKALREHLFDWQGLTWFAAIEFFAAAFLLRWIWPQLSQRLDTVAARRGSGFRRALRWGLIVASIAFVLLLPVLGGAFLGQVMMLVALFILMGLGLNIEVGLAGLLDLGFVAFFAIGAYVVALTTANSEFAVAALPFWLALPLAAIVAAAAGLLFGLPVLRVRGDYLAVATLGLGEIVRLLVISDTLKPLIGGAQGILGVPKPTLAGMTLASPSHLVYLSLAACLLVAYCAWRLQGSRIGRAWIALREDEDAAQTLGLNLVGIKLLAYGLGAAFAGIAGGIFATMVGSVFPHSFQLIISINVLALIILGGLGSIPGVIVGALALVGMPELLREFGEFRFLFYGLVLVIMMRFRAEGLWPSRASRRRSAILEEPG